MAVKFHFNKPIQSKPGATQFQPAHIIIDFKNVDVQIRFEEVNNAGFVKNGHSFVSQYVADQAQSLIDILITMNFSVKNLLRFLMEKLQQDKKVPSGTISTGL